MNFYRNNDGSTSVVFAIAAPLLIGGIVMMGEVGYWLHTKTEIQNTADMAAIAGAYEYIIANSTGNARKAAYADANDNSFDFASGTVTVNIPPVSGAYSGQDAVEVIITQDLPIFFAGYFSEVAMTTTASAVVSLGGQNSDACVFALAGSGTGINAGGSVDVNLNGCGLHANSTGTSAINGYGNVDITAACMSASGGIVFGGSATYTMDDCPSPRTNQPEMVDPYNDVDVPPGIGTLGCTNATGNKNSVTFPNPGGGIVKICNNSINVKGNVHLQPGTYVFNGTDVDFGSHGHLSGDGVTLIFMNDGEISGLNGNNSLSLTPPTTGTYGGIVIYGDRNTMSQATWDLNGNADISLTGAVYLPTLNVQYGGGAGVNATECTQLISNRVDFRGNSGFQNNCEDWGTRDLVGGSFTQVALVE